MNVHDYFEQWFKENPKWDIARYSSALVKKTRLDANLTQHELAKRMGTKQEAVARAERGDPKNTPTLKYLHRVAEACGKKLKLPEIVDAPQKET